MHLPSVRESHADDLSAQPAVRSRKSDLAGRALEPLPIETVVGNYFISNYPPFSCWTQDQMPALMKTLGQTPSQVPLSLYVHLPFCRQRCHYCYFRVHVRSQQSQVDEYVRAVLKEYSLYADFPALQNRTLNAVYFGGGSPSYLSVAQIEKLLGGLQEQQSWSAVEECTFECDPCTVTPDKLRTLKRLGVTRLSLGFQTLNDELLRRSGRDVRVQDCIRSYQMAREAGFDEINIDLLAGLPGEDRETWLHTMEEVLNLAPECITAYQLELTFNSGLYAALRGGRNLPLPAWPEKRQWIGEGFRLCEEAGYTIGSGYMAIRNPQWWRFVYTVENFWHGADLLAIGETSFGHLQGIHFQNADSFEDYMSKIERSQLPIRRCLVLTPEEKLRREVILQLKTGTLDRTYFRGKFEVELLQHFKSEFDNLLSRGLIELEQERICLTRDALLRVDWLLPSFYLPEHQGVRYT